MDTILLEILKLIVKEEVLNQEGVTPYKIMRKLGLYPSFAYKLVKKLESEGYISCRKNGKKKMCSMTLYGLFTVFKYDTLLRSITANLICQKLGIDDLSSVKSVIEMISAREELPRSYEEFIGWCLLHVDSSVVREILRQIMKKLNIAIFIDKHLIFVKQNGNSYLTCSYSCNNCIVRKCESIRSLMHN